MKITGEILKTERLKLKLSQQDVAAALKLSPRTINMIEEGEINQLPAKTFVRGFVKSYAEFLKLDSIQILKQFHEEVGLAHSVSKIAAVPSDNAKAKYSEEIKAKNSTSVSSVTPSLKGNINKSTFKIAGAIFVLVVGLAIINSITSKHQNEPSSAMTEIKQPESTEAQITSADNSVNNQNTNTTISSVDSTQAKINSDDVEKKNIDAAIDGSVNASTPPRTNLDKSVELVIEATKDTVISYAADGSNEFKNLDLQKNTFQIIKAKSGLRLKAPEGNAILLTVNGISKGAAGNDAKPVDLKF